MNSQVNNEYVVNWKNHMNHVRTVFDNLLVSNELIDVTLCCEGKRIGAHKVLLSACSNYFRETFKYVTCQHPIIVMFGIDYAVLTDILNFIYKGEVSVENTKLDVFLKTAEVLQISGLTGQAIVQNLNEEETSGNAETATPPANGVGVTKRVKRRMQEKVPEVTQEKLMRPEADSFFVSDVKCEPSELVNFEDPLEDPLLQAEEGQDQKEYFETTESQTPAEEEFKQPGGKDNETCTEEGNYLLKQPNVPSRYLERHFPETIPPTKRERPTRRCVLCHYERKVRRESRYWCAECKVGLCVVPCFKLYHTKSS